MEPRDWLLTLIAFKGAPGGLDPVRLQKGMFLHAMQSGLPPQELYDFRPYNYGPMSPAIYRDLDALEDEKLIERVAVEGRSWQRARPTADGIARARSLRGELGKEGEQALMALFDIKQTIAGQSFNELLRDVYDKYPAFATRSVFRG